MNWTTYDVIVAFWALLVYNNNIVITFQETTTLASNLETTTSLFITHDTKFNGREENDGYLMDTRDVQQHYRKHKHSSEKRSRDLNVTNIEKHYRQYYGSRYNELLHQLYGILMSIFSKISLGGYGNNETDKSRSKYIISYEDFKRIFHRYLYQNLKIISPDFIQYARQARGKKKKYKKFLLPMIMGALLVKSLILPIVLKGLAVLSSKAVMLSMISLLVASISSIKRGARQESEKTEVQVIHVPVKHHGYKRHDEEHEDVIHEDYYHDYDGNHHTHYDRSDPGYHRHHYKHNRGDYRAAGNERSTMDSAQYNNDQLPQVLATGMR